VDDLGTTMWHDAMPVDHTKMTTWLAYHVGKPP